MHFGRALAFYFGDDHWFRKVLAPAACQFIPILGLAAATGWAFEICRSVIRKDALELPALKFRRDLAAGLSVWGIILIFGIPAILWMGVGGLISVVLRLANSGTAAGSFDVFWCGIELGALVIAIGGAMGALAAIGRFAESGTIRSAVRIREVMAAVRSVPVAYLLAALAWIPLGLLAASGIAICGVGAFFTTAYALGSGFHLAGQAYAHAVSRRPSSAVPPAA